MLQHSHLAPKIWWCKFHTTLVRAWFRCCDANEIQKIHLPAADESVIRLKCVFNESLVLATQLLLNSVTEKRHGSPVPSRSPLVPMKPKAPAVAPTVAPSPGDTLAFRVPKDYPHSRFNKAPLAVYPPKGARNKPWWVELHLPYSYFYWKLRKIPRKQDMFDLEMF